MQIQPVTEWRGESRTAVDDHVFAYDPNDVVLVRAVGRECPDCATPYEEGDLVALVRDIYGMEWVHQVHVSVAA